MLRRHWIDRLPEEHFDGETATALPPGARRSAPSGDAGAPPLVRGASVGRYIVLHALGSGGMGIVFAAYDPELDRRVALKVLSSQVLDRTNPRQARQRLLREARAAARLSHPNVVTVHDVGSLGDRLFVAMELVEGPTLGEWLRAERRPAAEVLRMFCAAGAGLAAAHRAGLVHRDFKPGNVMIAEDGRPLVLDFGLAGAAGGEVPPAEGGAAGWTGAAGTPAYMAPEQAAGGLTDARSDQFSFCVALREALFGGRPAAFGGGSRGTVGRDGEGVPPRVRRALERGLASDPAERFASFDELLAELRPRSARRRAGWLAAVAVAAAAAGTVLGVASRPEPAAGLCAGAARHLAGVWDAGRRNAVRGSLLAAGGPFATDAASAVEAALDRYAASWVEAHDEACVATRVRGEQSEAMLDLAMACLDRRRRELRAATDLLAEADGEVARNALRVATSPAGPSRCLDRAALTAAVAPPAADAAAAVAGARNELAAARALRAGGKYREALVRSEQGLAAARQTGYAPVEAQALFEVAASSGRLGRRQELHDGLLAALSAAQAAGDDETVARSQVFLVVAALLRGELGAAHQWGDLSGGAVARLAGHGELAAQRELFLGMLATRENRHRDAAAHYRASLALDPELDVNERAALANNLAIAAWRLGRRDEGLAQLQRAIDLYEGAYGPRYPQLVGLLVNRSDFLREDGRLGEAVAAGRRSLEVAEAALGGDHPDTAWALTCTAQALLELGRPAEAAPLLERAVAVREAAATDPLNLALSRLELARALWDGGGDRTRARRLARRSLESYRELGAPGAEGAERAAEWLAANGAAR